MSSTTDTSGIGSLEISRVEAADEPTLRDWAAVTAAAARAEIGDAATAWAPEELIAIAGEPRGRRDASFWVGRVDGEVAVTGWLSMPLLDNLTSAEVEVAVRPDLRRRGFGSAMLEHLESVARAAGRSRFDAEAVWPYDGPADGAGASGIEFARAHGYEFGLGDVQRMVRLPIDDTLLRSLAEEAAPHHASYRIETFTGDVPDALVEGWLRVANTLMTEAPTGDLEREEEAVDVAAHREAERSQTAQGRTTWHAVAIAPDGDVVAYTQLVVPGHDPGFAYQWGTLVRRDHRGHRLGVAVKVANHLALQALADPADLAGRRVVTWNAEVNDHMIAINERLGFVPTSRCGEVQKRLPALP